MIHIITYKGVLFPQVNTSIQTDDYTYTEYGVELNHNERKYLIPWANITEIIYEKSRPVIENIIKKSRGRKPKDIKNTADNK